MLDKKQEKEQLDLYSSYCCNTDRTVFINSHKNRVRIIEDLLYICVYIHCTCAYIVHVHLYKVSYSSGIDELLFVGAYSTCTLEHEYVMQTTWPSYIVLLTMIKQSSMFSYHL